MKLILHLALLVIGRDSQQRLAHTNNGTNLNETWCTYCGSDNATEQAVDIDVAGSDLLWVGTGYDQPSPSQISLISDPPGAYQATLAGLRDVIIARFNEKNGAVLRPNSASTNSIYFNKIEDNIIINLNTESSSISYVSIVDLKGSRLKANYTLDNKKIILNLGGIACGLYVVTINSNSNKF